jgi:hypothetical protein
MKIQLIILLIVSIILVIVSSWNLSIFIRLGDASTQYPNDDQFDSACHVSKTYVSTGKTTSIIMLIIAVLLMFGSSFSIYYINSD